MVFAYAKSVITIKGAKKMKTLSDLIQSDAFQMFQSDKSGNDLFINDPERAERIYDAASEGGDGSTHYENIEDMREFLDRLSIFDPDYEEPEAEKDFDIHFFDYANIAKEIDDLEKWHIENGSIDKVCG